MGYLQELVGRCHSTHTKVSQAHCGTVQQFKEFFKERILHIHDILTSFQAVYCLTLAESTVIKEAKITKK
jgi:hypothetical protein